jgi:hypothetical protein
MEFRDLNDYFRHLAGELQSPINVRMCNGVSKLRVFSRAFLADWADWAKNAYRMRTKILRISARWTVFCAEQVLKTKET